MMSIVKQPLEVRNENMQVMAPPAGVGPMSIVLPCPVCQVMMPDNETLQQHLSQHLSAVTKLRKKTKHIKRRETTHFCELCGVTVKDLQLYAKHMKREHVIDLPRCHICAKLYPNQRELLKHMNQHRASVSMSCELCDLKFENAAELTKHLVEHLGPTSKKCPVCFNVYTCNNTVRKHMKIHSGERPHKCGICEMYFFQEWDVARHVLTKSHSKKREELIQQGKPAIEPKVSHQLMVTAKHSYLRMIAKPAEDKAKQLKQKAVQQSNNVPIGLPRPKETQRSPPKKYRWRRKKNKEGPGIYFKTGRRGDVIERQKRTTKTVNYANLEKDSSEDEDEEVDEPYQGRPPSPQCDKVEIEMDVDESPAGVITSEGIQTKVLHPMNQHNNNNITTNMPAPAPPPSVATARIGQTVTPSMSKHPKYMPVSLDSDGEDTQQSPRSKSLTSPKTEKKKMVSKKSITRTTTVVKILGQTVPSPDTKKQGPVKIIETNGLKKMVSKKSVTKNGLKRPLEVHVLRPSKQSMGSVQPPVKPPGTAPIMKHLLAEKEVKPITPEVTNQFRIQVPVTTNNSYVNGTRVVNSQLINMPITASIIKPSPVVLSVAPSMVSPSNPIPSTLGATVARPVVFTVIKPMAPAVPAVPVTPVTTITPISPVVNRQDKVKTERTVIVEPRNPGALSYIPNVGTNTQGLTISDAITIDSDSEDENDNNTRSFTPPALKKVKTEPGIESAVTAEVLDDSHLAFNDNRAASASSTIPTATVKEEPQDGGTPRTVGLLAASWNVAPSTQIENNSRALKITEEAMIIMVDSDSEDERKETVASKIKHQNIKNNTSPVQNQTPSKLGKLKTFRQHITDNPPKRITLIAPKEETGPRPRLHEEQPSHLYSCIDCGMDFPSQTLLDKHVKVHDEGEDPSALVILQDDGSSVAYMCVSCCGMFENKEALEKHKRVCFR